MSFSEHYRTEHLYGNPPLQGQTDRVLPPPVQDPPMLAYRGTSLAQSFDMRARMKASVLDNKPMMGAAMLTILCPQMARFMGQVGYDFVLLDWEHSPFSINQLVELVKTVQLASEGKTAVVVRLPSADVAWITWAMDSGASAVIVPHVETVEEAQQIVKHARHQFHGGKRSWAPAAILDCWDDAPKPTTINGQVGVILQIESVLGVESADEIAKVPGIDGLMFGPGDYTLDLMDTNIPKEERQEHFKVGRQKVIDAARKNQLAAFIPPIGLQAVKDAWQDGGTMMLCSLEAAVLARGLRKELTEAWEAIRGPARPDEDESTAPTK